MASFIGFSFPFRKGPTAFPEVATDDELIKQSLIQLVLTGKGERVFRPDVGANAYRYIFEPNNQILAQLIQTDIQQTIAKYEPRVTLLGVDVRRGTNTDQEAESSVVVTISYIVLRTNSIGTATISLDTAGV